MKPLHLAIGIFDGVHRGHRYLLRSVIETANQKNGVSGALTFHPHPKHVLKFTDAPQLIYPIQQRYYLLKKLGCNSIFIKKFTEPWARSSSDDFLTYLLQTFPNLSSLYVGEDFRFGYKRSGTLDKLQSFCQDNAIQFHSIQHLNQEGEKICSTRIRKALKDGFISIANQLLGEPYHCIGHLTPSHEFKHHGELKAKDGIYACRIVHKKFKQFVIVQVKQGLYYIISDLNSVLLKGTYLLEFQKEL